VTTEEPSSIALTPRAFTKRYHLLLSHLDELHRGVFDETAADESAALALLAKAAGVKQLANAEAKAKSFKRDIDFAKAQVYAKLKKDPPEGKKLTEPALAAAVVCDEKVQEAIADHIDAEKEFKEFSSILDLINDAHITFRGIGRKG
jgi:hypothetical protein